MCKVTDLKSNKSPQIDLNPTKSERSVKVPFQRVWIQVRNWEISKFDRWIPNRKNDAIRRYPYKRLRKERISRSIRLWAATLVSPHDIPLVQIKVPTGTFSDNDSFSINKKEPVSFTDSTWSQFNQVTCNLIIPGFNSETFSVDFH